MLFKIIALIIMLEHFYIAFIEIFLWEKPKTRRAFDLSIEFAARTKTFGLNQGLYNIFLAVGFLFGLIYTYSDPIAGHYILIYCMSCVLLAGIVGGFTVKLKIFFIQALPALFGLLVLCFN